MNRPMNRPITVHHESEVRSDIVRGTVLGTVRYSPMYGPIYSPRYGSTTARLYQTHETCEEGDRSAETRRGTGKRDEGLYKASEVLGLF